MQGDEMAHALKRLELHHVNFELKSLAVMEKTWHCGFNGQDSVSEGYFSGPGTQETQKGRLRFPHFFACQAFGQSWQAATSVLPWSDPWRL